MRVAIGQNLLEAAHANDVDLEGAQARRLTSWLANLSSTALSVARVLSQQCTRLLGARNEWRCAARCRGMRVLPGMLHVSRLYRGAHLSAQRPIVPALMKVLQFQVKGWYNIFGYSRC